MFLSATESASLIKLLAKRQIILGGGTIGSLNFDSIKSTTSNKPKSIRIKF